MGGIPLILIKSCIFAPRKEPEDESRTSTISKSTKAGGGHPNAYQSAITATISKD